MKEYFSMKLSTQTFIIPIDEIELFFSSKVFLDEIKHLSFFDDEITISKTKMTEKEFKKLQEYS